MAVVELARGNALSALQRWRWVGVFILVSLSLASQVPTYQSIGPAQVIDQPANDWTVSPGLELRSVGTTLELTAAAPAPQFASRALTVPKNTEFLSLRFCLAEAAGPASAAVMLASLRASALDFSRQYRMHSFDDGDAGECFVEAIPRRSGDGPVVLQLQLLKAGATLALSDLGVTPLEENPRWRVTRLTMLLLGVALVIRVFAVYREPVSGMRIPVLQLALIGAGLLTVAGIIFGCCVNVSLKADIFALLVVERSPEQGLSLAQLLQIPFPIREFSLFTMMHALLFGTATVTLGLVKRYAWIDMLMLGLATETLQLFVPGRGPGLSDVMVDWLGIAVAMLLVVPLRRSQRVSALL